MFITHYEFKSYDLFAEIAGDTIKVYSPYNKVVFTGTSNELLGFNNILFNELLKEGLLP